MKIWAKTKEFSEGKFLACKEVATALSPRVGKPQGCDRARGMPVRVKAPAHNH